jgi:glycosyltransferase involved in cell wall biosynthesis
LAEVTTAHDPAGARPASRPPRSTPRSVSVIIPAFNEEAILKHTVAHVHERLAADHDLDFFEIIVIENGSTDATLRSAEELSAGYDEVEVIVLAAADYGAALKTGFHAATGDVIVNFDADYYDLDFLAEALRVDADIVVAAKSILGSHDARVLLRRIVSRGFGWMVRTLLSVRVAETHGMKLFHTDAIADLLPLVHSTKDLFDTELLARSEWAGLKIRELPIRTEEMRHSRSGIIRRIPRTIRGLIRLRYKLREASATRVEPLPVVGCEESSDVAI